MIAYRLHFEEINLKAVELVRRGRNRRAQVLQLVVLDDRARRATSARRTEMGGGTLYDIGVYCINAARYLFRAEPTEVMAISVNSGAAKLAEIDESTGALLRFDGERVAAFVTSFNAADVASYRIVGTKGQLHVDPAYEYAEGLAYELTVEREDDAQADRQARSVRAGAAVFLGLHPQEPDAGAFRRGGSAGRAHRAGALRVGGNRQGGGNPALSSHRSGQRLTSRSPGPG